MKYLLLLFILAAVILPVTMPDLVQAQTGTSATGAGVKIPNPIKCDDINCLIAQVIRYILGTIAIVATLMFIWGGFMMLTSAGNAERIKKAKETLAWASIGIIVIMLSWAIIRFVLGGLINTTNTSPGLIGAPEPIGCCKGLGPVGSCTDNVKISQCQSAGYTFGDGKKCDSGC